MKENITINKLSENKYEFITKDINIEPGNYSLFILEKGLFVIKKQYYKINEDKNEIKQEIKKEDEKEQIIVNNQEKESNSENNEDDERKESTKEWYKKALEVKTKLTQEQFLVLTDLEEVRKISYVTRQEINSGEILGIRSFDKNYYVFKRVLFDKIKDSLLNLMTKEPMQLEEIIEKLQYPKEQILGAIELLKEQSDLIEVKKNLFKKI